MHKRHPGEGNCSGDLLLEREEKLQLGHCLHLLRVCKYLNLVDCLSFLPFDVIVYSDVGFLILIFKDAVNHTVVLYYSTFFLIGVVPIFGTSNLYL